MDGKQTCYYIYNMLFPAPPHCLGATPTILLTASPPTQRVGGLANQRVLYRLSLDLFTHKFTKKR